MSKQPSEPWTTNLEYAVEKKNWQPDRPRCDGCDAEFNAVNRRHHCRRCGACVCDDCSKKNLTLPGHSSSERVCNNCFASVSRLRAWVKAQLPDITSCYNGSHTALTCVVSRASATQQGTALIYVGPPAGSRPSSPLTLNCASALWLSATLLLICWRDAAGAFAYQPLAALQAVELGPSASLADAVDAALKQKALLTLSAPAAESVSLRGSASPRGTVRSDGVTRRRAVPSEDDDDGAGCCGCFGGSGKVSGSVKPGAPGSIVGAAQLKETMFSLSFSSGVSVTFAAGSPDAARACLGRWRDTLTSAGPAAVHHARALAGSAAVTPEALASKEVSRLRQEERKGKADAAAHEFLRNIKAGGGGRDSGAAAARSSRYRRGGEETAVMLEAD